MTSIKLNYLNLQFILPFIGKNILDIQKNIIFINIISKIWSIINIIQA